MSIICRIFAFARNCAGFRDVTVPCASPNRRDHMTVLRLASAGLASALLLGGPAQAGTFTYEATLNDLSGLGGSGRADLIFDDAARTLQVLIQASGFAPDMLHVQHIHGPIGGNAVSPTLADDDADGDGVLELLEGAPKYGGILLSLFDEAAAMAGDPFNGFPSAPNGVIDFAFTYDLDATGAFQPGVSFADLFPLEDREIVIHGAFLAPGIGGVGNEGPDNDLFKNGGYSNFVPVAAGEIVAVGGTPLGVTPSPVPLPAAGWALIAALGTLAAMGRRRASAG
jgi:hypothetical protein